MMSALFFVAAVAPLIFLHELGHYLVGRWCGVKADVFSIGFGRPLAKWFDRRGTRWQIGWLPLGGYVRFAGDMSAVGSPSAAWLALPAVERNATFQAKSVGQRAAIVAAGPIANFLVAILAFMALFAIVGEPRLPPVIAGVAPQSAAAKAGLRTGDRVVAIDGDVIDDFADIAMRVQVRADRPVAITVERAGRRTTLTATPTLDIRRDRFGREARHGMLGVAAPPAVWERPSLLALPGAALRFTGTMLVNQAQGLWQIVTGERSVREMSGPIGTAQVSGEVASLGVLNFLFFMAFISINLGFINLLPVPTLDGGHLMFYAAEALQGRPVRKRAQEVAYRAGFVALVTFMVMVTFNDMRSTAIGARLFGLIG